MTTGDFVRVDAKSGSVEARQTIDRPIEDVFRFFSDPHNLERITPDFLRFRVVSVTTPAIEDGTLIHYRLKIRGVPVRWTSRIEAWKPPYYFCDRQIRGPYGHWFHEHIFEKSGKGTVIQDRVRFRLPFHALTRWIALSWVASDVEAIFRYRTKRIADLL